MRFKNLIFLLGILIPCFLIFKNLFLPGYLAWGDAPHFFPEEIKKLVAEPLAWTSRGNSFGGINQFIFLWPLMFLYGLIGDNNLAIRLLFYIPSVALAGLGTFFLTRFLRLSKVASFFSVLVYLFNTYYLLVIDGGQAGVALAYGIFPFTLLFAKKFFETPSINTFYLSLLFLFFCGIADPRISLIAFLTILAWQVVELKFKTLKYLVPMVVVWAGLNLYWIYPLLKNGASHLGIFLRTEIVSWYHPLLLYSPHWPENIFGKMTKPPYYFFVVPLLILWGGFNKRNIKFLILTFLFGLFILGLVPFANIPFGFAFRDTTKFFIPLILFGGILLGQAVEMISKKFKRFFLPLPIVACYFYLMFLVFPAVSGEMNYVLSNRHQTSDFQTIYKNLKGESGFFRAVWLPERHPLTYETEDTPAIDAKTLASFWPFSSINAGEDVFNFLNNENFPELFKIFGIKYLILSGNPRELTKSESEEKDWKTILGLVDKNEELERIDWGTDVPVYKVNNPYPKFFSVKQLVAVVGPPVAGFQSPTSIFFEDGKWDPHILEGKDKSSVKLVFNKADKIDLAMGFLQKYFISPKEAFKNEWAYYPSEEYLKYKYELLIRGVNFTDLDYGKGISFSTQKNEKLEFRFEVNEPGDYVFLYRAIIPEEDQTRLTWEIVPLSLAGKEYIHTIENFYDLSILNTVALVPIKEFEAAQNLAETYIEHFGLTSSDKIKKEEVIPLALEKFGTLKYKLLIPTDNFWVIMTDSYHPLWQLRRGVQYYNSVPVISMVNGFYVEHNWRDLGIEFRGQENVRRGLYWSAVSFLVLTIIYLWFYHSKKSS